MEQNFIDELYYPSHVKIAQDIFKENRAVYLRRLLDDLEILESTYNTGGISLSYKEFKDILTAVTLQKELED